MIYRVSFAALVFATSVFVASAEPVKSLPGEDGRIPVAKRESQVPCDMGFPKHSH
jgi:hypothetical protein